MIHWKDTKLKVKFLIIYIVGLALPLLLLNGVLILKIFNDIEISQREAYQQSFDNIQQAISEKISCGVEKMHYLYQNEELYSFLDYSYTKPAEFVEAYNLWYSRLSILFLAGLEIKHISIAAENPTIFKTNNVEMIDDSTRWFPYIRDKEPSMAIYYDTVYPEIISLVRIMDFYSTYNHYFKAIKIDLDLKSIKRIISDNSIFGYFYLKDSRGQIVESSEITEENLNLNYQERSLGRSILEKDWIIAGAFTPKLNLSFFLSEYQSLMLTMLLVFIIAGGFIYLLSRSIYQRIMYLSESMVQIDNIDDILEKKLEVKKENNDEIGILYKKYNFMLKRMNELIVENTRTKVMQKEIELSREKTRYNALLSQINPHYLFNVFESIRMKSLINGEKETAAVIKKVSTSYRRLISWNSDLISLEEELETVSDFFDIQKYRFGDDFDFEIRIDPAILKMEIPKYFLQPFVENACIHGLENSQKKGRVEVSGSCKNQGVLFTVEDNGVGIEEEALAQIKQSLADTKIKTEHVGLANVYHRLKMYYPDLSFDIVSNNDSGTKVIILIPGGPNGKL